MRPRVSCLPVLLALAAALLSWGCVDRKMFIKSDPPGARVALNLDDPLPEGTPVVYEFSDHGTYAVHLTKEGYEPLDAEAPVKTPWWSWFPFDLFTDLLIPVTFEDHHEFTFVMEKRPEEQPMGAVIEDVRKRHAEVLGRAEEMRREVNENKPPEAK